MTDDEKVAYRLTEDHVRAFLKKKRLEFTANGIDVDSAPRPDNDRERAIEARGAINALRDCMNWAHHRSTGHASLPGEEPAP